MKKFAKTTLTSMTILALAASTSAVASPMPSRVLLASETHNGDYLAHVEEPLHEKTLNEKLFNKEITSELSRRYSKMVEQYETQHNYQLDEMRGQLRFRDANRDLVDWTWHRMLDEHVKSPVRRFVGREVRETLHHHDDDRPIARRAAEAEAAKRAEADGKSSGNGASGQPQAKGGSATASSSGSGGGLSVRDIYQHLEDFYNHGYQLNHETLMRFQYDMPGGVMDLALSGGLVDTSIDYFVMPLGFSMNGFGSANPERATFRMAKSLGGLGLSTGAHYGLASRSLSYGMAKTLVGPLSASVGQAHYLSRPDKDETTYRLDFGVSF